MPDVPDIIGRKFRVPLVSTAPKERAGPAVEIPMATGTCVWVHPKGRYAILEFPKCGNIRESYTLKELGICEES